MGENICKSNDWQGVNLQNLQTAPAAQYQKNKQPNQKIDRRPKQIFLQRRHTDSQETHEKMINTTNYQRNTNQNHNEISHHTSQNGHHQNSTNDFSQNYNK